MKDIGSVWEAKRTVTQLDKMAGLSPRRLTWEGELEWRGVLGDRGWGWRQGEMGAGTQEGAKWSEGERENSDRSVVQESPSC